MIYGKYTRIKGLITLRSEKKKKKPVICCMQYPIPPTEGPYPLFTN